MGQMHGLEVPQKEIARKESQRERERERADRQAAQFVGLSKKSNSTSQLTATGKGDDEFDLNRDSLYFSSDFNRDSSLIRVA